MPSKTYRANTMKDALTRVRRDLGGDALILSAREVRRRRLFGLGPKAVVEVVATDTLPSELEGDEPAPTDGPHRQCRLGELAVAGRRGAWPAARDGRDLEQERLHRSFATRDPKLRLCPPILN